MLILGAFYRLSRSHLYWATLFASVLVGNLRIYVYPEWSRWPGAIILGLLFLQVLYSMYREHKDGKKVRKD